MTLLELRDAPSPEIAAALSTFERRFIYPLGLNTSFRISHGEDYPRFFRAIGNATCFVAMRNQAVTGALSVAIRPIILPDGSERQSAYIGDLKVDPAVRGSLDFLRLAQAGDRWARPLVTAAYGVVMDGTRVSPASYTGRLGIEPFTALEKICVVRIASSAEPIESDWTCPAVEGAACHRELSADCCTAAGGDPAERSEIRPVWLIQSTGLACGRIEDTRRAKRLIDSDGNEMPSAHLACFAWKTPQAGAELIHVACRHVGRLGLPAMFTAVPARRWLSLETALGPVDKLVATATIYGAGLDAGPAWNINSSEI